MKKYPELITKTPTDWPRKTDINDYAQRQAISCKFLEKAFDKIRTAQTRGLFEYLLKVHDRQYDDIAKIIEIKNDPFRKSFYFDQMYQNLNIKVDDKNRDEATLLIIHAVSYLRGQDRYELLQNYQETKNLPFIHVWSMFFNDATKNYKRVFDFLDENFEQEELIIKTKNVLIWEDKMIHQIWRKNNVKTT